MTFGMCGLRAGTKFRVLGFEVGTFPLMRTVLSRDSSTPLLSSLFSTVSIEREHLKFGLFRVPRTWGFHETLAKQSAW